MCRLLWLVFLRMLFIIMTRTTPTNAFLFGVAHQATHHHRWRYKYDTSTTRSLSDWSDFQSLDDDVSSINETEYAVEDDSQETKAQVGATLEPPEISPEQNVEPIIVPQGSQLELNEQNVLGVLQACREEIGTLFGYSAENRGVGITGGVDYVELDGPSVVLSLKGRFWHLRSTVLNRVGAYMMSRIPEIVSVDIEDEWQLTDEANNAAL